MTRIYAEIILILLVTPSEAIPIHCVTTDKKRLNEVQTLEKDVTIKEKLKSRCCPYDFDPSHCKLVDDRLLCGYNRNIGGFQNENVFKELENGCRIRGGRVECGYVKGPFVNARRPPIDNNPDYDNIVSQTTTDFGGMENEIPKEALKHVTTEKLYYGTTRCLEIRERVVCRYK